MAKAKGTHERIKITNSIYEFFGIEQASATKVIEELVKELTWVIIKSNTIREEIDKDGVVVDFKQGKQEMKIQHPAMKAYNDVVKAQTTLFKTLKDLTGSTDKTQTVDELAAFRKRKENRRSDLSA